MKFKSTFILGIVFLVLLGYLYYYEMPKQDNIKEEKKFKEKIFDFDIDSLQFVTFLMVSEEVEIKKVEGKDEFIMEEPVNSKADMEVVNKFLSGLKEIRYKKLIDGKDFDLRNVRLDNPYYEITLNFKDGSQKVFRLGDMNVTSDMIYANRDGDDNIYLLDISARDVVDLDSYSFREKSIFKDDFSNVGQIQITTPKGENIVMQKEGADWIITKPKKYKADIVAVKALINNVKNLKAVRFPDETVKHKEQYDFSKSDISMTLTSTDGEVIQSFMLIKKGPMVNRRLSIEETEKEDCLTEDIKKTIDTSYLKEVSTEDVYLISYNNDYLLFEKELDDFRNKPVFLHKMDEIYKLEIMRDNKLLVLSRNDKGGWSDINNTDPISYDAAYVGSIFNYLSFVEAIEFIDDADMNDETYDFKNPALSLSFYDKAGVMVEKLVIGNEDAQYVFLQKLNDATVYMIDKSFKERFKM
jgi:hypothetical protein